MSLIIWILGATGDMLYMKLSSFKQFCTVSCGSGGSLLKSEETSLSLNFFIERLRYKEEVAVLKDVNSSEAGRVRCF